MMHPGWAFYRDYEHYQIRARESDPGVGNKIASRDWRFKKFFGLCDSHGKARILDIGCGDGKFLALARGRGFDVYGTDLDPRAVELAKTLRGLDKVQAGDWDDVVKRMGWKDFDAVTLFDVLEHLASPVGMAKALYNLVRPGGSACISVPRFDRWPRLFDAEADTPPHHLTLWTEKALRDLLVGAGFSDVRVIKKPLTTEDFLMHIVWRTRRMLRHLPANREAATVKEEGEDHAGQRRAGAALAGRLAVMSLCRPFDWLLCASHLGRGFALLAYATKGPR